MDELDSRELESAVEGILFASGEPVHVDRICTALSIARDEALQILCRLRDYYTYERRGIRLLRMDDNWQLCSAPDHAEVIRKAFEIRKPAKLSQPALEALTIIAYYQPTTRAYVDKLRGVDSTYTVNMLQERGLIEACGRLQVPGRPVLYRTTEQFLRAFHLTSLEELPPLPGTEDTSGNTGDGEQLTLPMEPRRSISPEAYSPQHSSQSADSSQASDSPPVDDSSQPGDSLLTDSSQTGTPTVPAVPDVPNVPDIPPLPKMPDIADLPEIPEIPDLPDDLDALPDEVLRGMSNHAGIPQTAERSGEAQMEDFLGDPQTEDFPEDSQIWNDSGDSSSERRHGVAKKRKSPPFPRRGLKKRWRGQSFRYGDGQKSRREDLSRRDGSSRCECSSTRRNCHKSRRKLLLSRKAALLKCKNMLSGRGNILLNRTANHMATSGEDSPGRQAEPSGSHGNTSGSHGSTSGGHGNTSDHPGNTSDSHPNTVDSYPEAFDHCAETSGKDEKTVETSTKGAENAETSARVETFVESEKSSENCRKDSGGHKKISGRWIRCLLYGCWLSWPWWWG